MVNCEVSPKHFNSIDTYNPNVYNIVVVAYVRCCCIGGFGPVRAVGPSPVPPLFRRVFLQHQRFRLFETNPIDLAGSFRVGQAGTKKEKKRIKVSNEQWKTLQNDQKENDKTTKHHNNKTTKQPNNQTTKQQ